MFFSSSLRSRPNTKNWCVSNMSVYTYIYNYIYTL
jgi:hypothetical protein